MTNIQSRKRHYIITKRIPQPFGVTDVDFGTLAAEVEAIAGVAVAAAAGDHEAGSAVVRQLTTRDGNVHALVARLSEPERTLVEAQRGDLVLVEEDRPLSAFETSLPAPPPNGSTSNALALLNLTPFGDAQIYRILVQGPAGEPLVRAVVALDGESWSDTVVTDADGLAELLMFGETPETLQALTIRPAHGYWSRQIDRPALTPSALNTVTLEKLAEPDHATAQTLGWGADAMGFGPLLPPGAAVRIAVIDSGIAGSHPDLAPAEGRDFGDTGDPHSVWREDGTGHGTHVAGASAARDNAIGIRGMAPGAILIGLRIFPDARISKLIEAIDWCADHDIDVVNMSLGAPSSSEALQQRIAAAKARGVTMIAAAGNSGNDVNYPAAYAEVVAVAAVGKHGTFPPDSLHSRHAQGVEEGSDGLFAAGFTCRGPEIDVCAPGVAVVSTVPPDGYAAWDGTSMACPHVTGFAARLLQEHDEIRAMPRNAARVTALVEAIRERCIDVGLPPELQGAGLPRLEVAGNCGEHGGNGACVGSKVPSHALTALTAVLREAIAIIEKDLVKH